MIASATPPPARTSTLPDYISPSAAKSYLACSLRFYCERVLPIKKPTTAALHLGKSVHAALQAFHLARWRGTDDSPEVVAAAFEDSFTKLERDEGPVKWKEGEREKSRLAGLRVVAAYLDSPEAPTTKPRAVEVPLTENIPGLCVPLTGTIDLVTDIFAPIDFKSAAAKPDPKHAAFDHELQLVAHHLLLEKATGEKPPSLDLVFLAKTKVPQVILGFLAACRPQAERPGDPHDRHRRHWHVGGPLPPAARHVVHVVSVPQRVQAVARNHGGKEGRMNRIPLHLLLIAGGLMATACGRHGGATPPPDLTPIGEGLKVIGFALVGAAVIVSLGCWFRKSD